AFLQSTVTREDLAKSIPAPRTGRISFLTLTNHFYSRANPLPEGKGMYPLLMSIPDVVGFDLYPLQVWCRPAFSDVMDSQHELGRARGPRLGANPERRHVRHRGEHVRQHRAGEDLRARDRRPLAGCRGRWHGDRRGRPGLL